MKILLISSEAVPLAKVGGLGDVVGSLPRVLRELDHDVRILMPQYGSLDTQRFPLTPEITGFNFSGPEGAATVNLNRTTSNGTVVYTLDNPQHFGTKEIYTNDLEKFFFFSRAVFEMLPALAWQPEIIHCHDWLTALIVMWQKKAGYPYSSVFTIHNLAYQGAFDQNFMNRHDLKKDWEFFPPEAPRPPLNFMSQAILWTDMVTTVSDTYAREITTPESGEGLDPLLRYRQDSLTGIVNGIDYEEWNPQTDKYLPLNFTSDDMSKRVFNKIALQRVAGLPIGSNTPLIGMVQRLDEQKGIDIVGQGMDTILKETGAQFVILGKGRENYQNQLRQLAAAYPQQVSVFIAFEEALAHLIYGGSDMFLMPSRFEPCGLGQMIAMRYGALPVVRHTGGLVDTVPGFNSDLSQGNGFVFHEYTPEALIAAVKKGCTAFRDKTAWGMASQRVSRIDFSWQSSARKYEALYRKLLERKEGMG